MRRRFLVTWVAMLGSTAVAAGFLAAACSPEERSFTSSGSSAGSGGGDSSAATTSGGTGGGGGSGTGGEAGGGGGSPDASTPPPSPPEVVAAGLDEPYSIAVDDQSVFILSAATLLRCPVAGCPAPVLLAEGLAPPAGAFSPPYLVSVDLNFVHWLASRRGSTARSYFRCPAAGCVGDTPREVWEPLNGTPTQIQVGDDGVVRISEKFDVYECDGSTCTRIPCVHADSIRSFVMDGTTVYWSHTTDPGGVYFCNASDSTGAIQLHAEPGAAMAIQGDIHYVMSVAKGSIFSCKKAGCGGSPAAFVEGEQALTSMAVGPTGVYWTAAGDETRTGGAVKMCPLDGCGAGPRVIASGQARPTSIRLRNGFVYWANRGVAGPPMSGEIVRAGL
ncbi:hypothetical protein SOCE26_009350 [Sorangium cellulosum]|uniref:Secreted protein n=1 Tax=Sorangium cellulosum TaxID=56 RepID=A0A2L0EJQ8_SORCE|nr:hypothetical protein [Sorangium cellulosum]AUX39542.1 hypothetical protein SOCE26_009350 [Sorangium cellulosum]